MNLLRKTDAPRLRIKTWGHHKSLALRELEPLTGALLSVLLALLRASVARKQPFGLQRLAQFGIELDQCAGDAHLHRIGLRAHAAALHGGKHVEGRQELGQHQRTNRRNPLLFGHEIDLKTLAVYLEVAAAWAQKHTRDRRLPSSRSVILNQICHSLSWSL